MGTTIQQLAGEMSSTPINGQPWNFRGLLDFYIVPRSVAVDTDLPPGARLLWGVVYRYSVRNGECSASDESLARALAVSRSQFIRYARALEKAGLLKSTPRPGKTAVRALTWDSRFAGKIRQGVSDMARGGVINGTGGAPYVAPPYKEDSSSIGVFKRKSAATLKNGSPKPAAPPAQKPASEWTEEDYLARGRAMGFPEHVIAKDMERARARRAKPQAERMVKASELGSELAEAIRR